MTPEVMADLHARAFTTPRPWSAPEFASLLAGAGVFVLGDTRGFVMGRAIAGEAEVLTLAVAPEARRQGIARRLMAEFCTRAIGFGAQTAFLEVAESNSAAISLYRTVGYVISGRRRGYFNTPQGQKIDAVVMTKPLLA